ncbi:MAG: hypothetical protein LBH43_01630 [Treponema sp.]|jgi:hypothetical protein|nr:hypothetical protein [Treponema sp.]
MLYKKDIGPVTYMTASNIPVVTMKQVPAAIIYMNYISQKIKELFGNDYIVHFNNDLSWTVGPKPLPIKITGSIRI